jgi:hypothetical protein
VSHFSRAIIWRCTGHFLSITAYKRYEILLPHLWGGFPPRRLSNQVGGQLRTPLYIISG